MKEIGTIYLIHFDEGLKVRTEKKTGREVLCQHYLGWSTDWRKRHQEHKDGNGSKLMAEVARRGIGWRVVRRWKGTRDDERRIKRLKNSPGLCGVCESRRRRDAHIPDIYRLEVHGAMAVVFDEEPEVTSSLPPLIGGPVSEPIPGVLVVDGRGCFG
jgi:hypothetical protein